MRHGAVAASCAVMLLVGCSEPPPPEAGAVSDSAERGPLKMTVQVRPKQVWIGDPISIDVDFHAPDDYLARLPTADDLGDLEVIAEDESDPRPAADGGLEWRKSFTVESLVSGTVEIPPLVIKYARKPGEPDAKPEFDSELACGTLEIEVLSALTTQDSVDRPRDITGTVLPAEPPMAWWQWALIVGGAVLTVLLAYLVYRAIRRRRLRPAPPIPPEVWALRVLSELVAEWVEQGRAREYYYRLSEIVRVYIEKKFSLAAPEMTTEEFLITLARDRGALPYDADRLRAFLEACDLVKYAAYSPRREDAEQALSTARAFVDATAARQTVAEAAA